MFYFLFCGGEDERGEERCGETCLVVPLVMLLSRTTSTTWGLHNTPPHTQPPLPTPPRARSPHITFSLTPFCLVLLLSFVSSRLPRTCSHSRGGGGAFIPRRALQLDARRTVVCVASARLRRRTLRIRRRRSTPVDTRGRGA